MKIATILLAFFAIAGAISPWRPHGYRRGPPHHSGWFDNWQHDHYRGRLYDSNYDRRQKDRYDERYDRRDDQSEFSEEQNLAEEQASESRQSLPSTSNCNCSQEGTHNNQDGHFAEEDSNKQVIVSDNQSLAKSRGSKQEGRQRSEYLEGNANREAQNRQASSASKYDRSQQQGSSGIRENQGNRYSEESIHKEEQSSNENSSASSSKNSRAQQSWFRNEERLKGGKASNNNQPSKNIRLPQEQNQDNQYLEESAAQEGQTSIKQMSSSSANKNRTQLGSFDNGVASQGNYISVQNASNQAKAASSQAASSSLKNNKSWKQDDISKENSNKGSISLNNQLSKKLSSSQQKQAQSGNNNQVSASKSNRSQQENRGSQYLEESATKEHRQGSIDRMSSSTSSKKNRTQQGIDTGVNFSDGSKNGEATSVPPKNNRWLEGNLEGNRYSEESSSNEHQSKSNQASSSASSKINRSQQGAFGNGNFISEQNTSKEAKAANSSQAASSSAKNSRSQQGNGGKHYFEESSSKEEQASSSQASSSSSSSSSKTSRTQQGSLGNGNTRGNQKLTSPASKNHQGSFNDGISRYSEQHSNEEANSSSSQASSSSASKNSRSQEGFFPSDGRPSFGNFSEEHESRNEQSASNQQSSSSRNSFSANGLRFPRAALSAGLKGSRLLEQEISEHQSHSTGTPSGSSYQSSYSSSSSKHSFSGDRLPHDEAITFSCSSTTSEGIYPLQEGYCSPFFYYCSERGETNVELKFECPEDLYYDEETISCKDKNDVATCQVKKPIAEPVEVIENEPEVTKNPLPIFPKPVVEVVDEPKNRTAIINPMIIAMNDTRTEKPDAVRPTPQMPQLFLCEKEGMIEDPSEDAQTPWGVCSKAWYHCPEVGAMPEKRVCPASLYYDEMFDTCETRKNIYACTGVERVDYMNDDLLGSKTVFERRHNRTNSPPATHTNTFELLSTLNDPSNFTSEEPDQSREDFFCTYHLDGKYFWDGVCSGKFVVCDDSKGYVITCPDRMFFDMIHESCAPKKACMLNDEDKVDYHQL